MQPSRLIVLTVDALATAPLESYGGSWLETPGLNRLASTAAVFDRVVACSMERADVLRQYFGDAATGHSVAAEARKHGMPTLLFTDSSDVTSMAGASAFDECTLIRGDDFESGGGLEAELAADLEDTLLARLFAAALLRREALDASPHLLWIHASSLLHTWDAPLGYRGTDDLQVDEEDDEEMRAAIDAARTSARPPRLVLDEDDDPDLALAWMAAYGAQVRVLDSLVEVLLEALDQEPETALVLASTGGFALAEHGWIGADAGPPRSPRIQLPLVIHDPRHPPVRSLRPVSSDRLAATLIEMLGRDGSEPSERSLWSEVVPRRWSQGDDPLGHICVTDPPRREPELVLKTAPGWFYARSGGGAESLYLKPDDRNDANDVASLKPDVLERFRPM